MASLGVAAGFGLAAPGPAVAAGRPAPRPAAWPPGDGCSATAAVAATATRAAIVTTAPRARDMGNCSRSAGTLTPAGPRDGNGDSVAYARRSVSVPTRDRPGASAGPPGATAIGPSAAAGPRRSLVGMTRESESGLPVDPVYRPGQPAGFDPAAQLGEPGRYPFTRGIYPQMYTARPWTIRQYSGFSTAADSNRRFHQLIEAGGTGLSVAFDLPTQMGYDSDAPIARGEVGKVGVAIDSIEDMRILLDGIPLDSVSTSMTINAPAAVLLLLYQLVAEEHQVAPGRLAGTIQNDILKEYIARGTYIYPPQPSLRLVADTFAYCRAEIPRWNTISISGYHMAEAGATPVQEIAFTLANAREYVRAALASGLGVDEFGPRLSFFFVARTTLLEEVAKFRAARRIWASIMRDEFGAADPKSQMLRFHTQTA